MSKPPKPPHPGDLIKIIRQLAANSLVAFSNHAFDDRMGKDNRGIEIIDVYEVLRLGDIDGKIVPGENPGEWKCLVRGILDWTPREAGVATVVVRKDRLIIVTTEWMDK